MYQLRSAVLADADYPECADINVLNALVTLEKGGRKGGA